MLYKKDVWPVGGGVDHAGLGLHEVGGAVAARRGSALAEVLQVRHVQLALGGLNLATTRDHF